MSKLYDLFTKASSLTNAQQKSYLIDIANEYPEHLDELSAMLEVDRAPEEMKTQYWSNLLEQESEQWINISADLTNTIIGAFQLKQLIAKGGMGSVYIAHRCDQQFEQTVAIKVINAELKQIIGEHALIREAGFMAKLTHPNIGKVFDAGVSEQGHHFIVMEYISGCNIEEKFLEETLSTKNKLQLFSDLCDAVNHAHQMQIVHADLKPANILVTPDNQIKVLDFGIARMFNNRGSHQAFNAYLNAMTADFASPELLAGENPTMFSDIYALGKVFERVFLLTNGLGGNYKFQQELVAIVDKATAKNITARYASVLELKADIQRFNRGYVVRAFESPPLYRIKKFTLVRHPIAASICAAALISIGTLSTNLFIQHQQLKSAKFQSDLMVEKLSNIIQLIDRKKSQDSEFSVNDLLSKAYKLLNDSNLSVDSLARFKITLAGSFEGSDDRKQAISLYQEIIKDYDLLIDKNIAFIAGAKLTEIFTYSYELDRVEQEVEGLVSKLTFHPSIKLLPTSVEQAMFYHRYLDAIKYIQNTENTYRISQQSIDLLKAIQNNYFEQLDHAQQAEVLGFTGRAIYMHLIFQAESYYLFEGLSEQHYQTKIVPKVEQAMNFLRRARAKHEEINYLDAMARIDLILFKLSIMLDEPVQALTLVERSMALSKLALGEQHNDMIQRYGEASKYFRYDNPSKSVEYALASLSLATKSRKIEAIQYIYAISVVLHAYKANGELDSYQRLAQTYFHYYLNLADENRSKRIVYTFALSFFDYYRTLSDVPVKGLAIVDQFKRDVAALSLREGSSPDDYERLFTPHFFDFLTDIISGERFSEIPFRFISNAMDYSNANAVIEQTRELAFKRWYQGDGVADSQGQGTGNQGIIWHPKESRTSFNKLEHLVRSAHIQISIGDIDRAEQLYVSAVNIVENAQFAQNSAWLGQVNLLASEIYLHKKEREKATRFYATAKRQISQHYPESSLIYRHLIRLGQRL